LRNENHERVEDDEARDDDADQREAEQRVVEETEQPAHRRTKIPGRLVRGDDLEPRTDLIRQLILQRCPRNPRAALDIDEVELTGYGKHALRGRQLECDRRHRAEIECRAEAEQAHDAKLLRRPLGSNRDRVADPELIATRRALVDDDLVGPSRGVTLAVVHQAKRTDPGARGPRETEIGRAAVLDRLPVLAQKLRLTNHNACGRFHRGVLTHFSQHTFGHSNALDVATPDEGIARSHNEVDVGNRLIENAVERTLQRVGQHVARADERHPKQHRNCGEREPHPARKDALDRRLEHVRAVAPAGG
jgi:hypothetical protein